MKEFIVDIISLMIFIITLYFIIEKTKLLTNNLNGDFTIYYLQFKLISLFEFILTLNMLLLINEFNIMSIFKISLIVIYVIYLIGIAAVHAEEEIPFKNEDQECQMNIFKFILNYSRYSQLKKFFKSDFRDILIDNEDTYIKYNINETMRKQLNIQICFTDILPLYSENTLILLLMRNKKLQNFILHEIQTTYFDEFTQLNYLSDKTLNKVFILKLINKYFESQYEENKTEIEQLETKMNFKETSKYELKKELKKQIEKM